MQIMLYTDLIFMSYSKDKNSNDFTSAGFINKLLVDTGRPVMVIPKNWQKEDLGQQILLGWNETRESARALHEALALMKEAKKVDVLTPVERDGLVWSSDELHLEDLPWEYQQKAVMSNVLALEGLEDYDKPSNGDMRHVESMGVDFICFEKIQGVGTVRSTIG